MTEQRPDTDETNANAVLAALENDKLVLVVQPIIDAQSGAIASYEGLLRLRGTDGALHSATDLIESAERAHLVQHIDCRALELGLALLKRHPGLVLSLNVSSLTAHDGDWVALLRTLAAGAPDLTPRLTIEITETAIIKDMAKVAAFVDDVRALGCRVAIDDFGAGYTSFRHLKSLHVDVLKIDGAFITDLPGDPQSRIIAKTMIDMAHNMGLKTVAEWVGSAEAASFLRDAGVTYLQGFLYGQPMPVEELAASEALRVAP
ncbi:EAL domain-containing protein [Hyphomicrobium sp.]|uniref:EAL domain-containing protein n=1 Tax=Hyphomicrobium sp. TaxID=82 RepID=UPI003F71710D